MILKNPRMATTTDRILLVKFMSLFYLIVLDTMAVAIHSVTRPPKYASSFAEFSPDKSRYWISTVDTISTISTTATSSESKSSKTGTTLTPAEAEYRARVLSRDRPTPRWINRIPSRYYAGNSRHRRSSRNAVSNPYRRTSKSQSAITKPTSDSATALSSRMDSLLDQLYLTAIHHSVPSGLETFKELDKEVADLEAERKEHQVQRPHCACAVSSSDTIPSYLRPVSDETCRLIKSKMLALISKLSRALGDLKKQP